MATKSATLGPLFFLIFFVALVTLPLKMNPPSGAIHTQEETMVVIEHSEPARINLLLQTTRGKGLIELENIEDQIIDVSIPEAWNQWEIRGADITDLLSEEPGLGYRKWHIPPHSTVSFTTDQSLSPLTVEHPLSSLLTLNVTWIDVDKNLSKKNIYLLQKETRNIGI